MQIQELDLSLEQISQAFRVLTRKEPLPEELEQLTKQDWTFLAGALRSLLEEKQNSTLH